jgi:hypothetical protein
MLPYHTGFNPVNNGRAATFCEGIWRPFPLSPEEGAKGRHGYDHAQIQWALLARKFTGLSRRGP